MPTVSLEEATTPITVAEFKASFYEALSTVGVSTTTWKHGAVTRTIIAIVCVVFAAFSRLITALAGSAFLGTAAGLWARLHARYGFNAIPQDATFAEGPLLLSNSSGTPRSFAPYALEVQASGTRKSYRNTAAVTVAAGATNVPVTIQAVEVGSESSALVGEIDTIVPAVTGLTCSNAVVLVGLDDEAQAQLQSRCAAKLQPFADSPKNAYLIAAQGAKRANGSSLGIDRIAIRVAAHCKLDICAATASGGVPGVVGDLSTDLGALDEAIQTQAVPLAVTCDVHSAVERVIDVNASVWLSNTTGSTPAQLEAAIAAELEAFVSAMPIGGNVLPGAGSGFIFAEDLRAAIMRARADGASIRAFRCTVQTPTGDIALAPNEVPVLGTVTLVVTRVAPNSGVIPS